MSRDAFMEEIHDFAGSKVTLNGKEVDINMILPTSPYARSDLEDAQTMFIEVMFVCVFSPGRVIPCIYYLGQLWYSKREDGVDRGGRGVHHRPRQQLRAVWTQSRQEGQDYRPPELSCHQEPDIHLHYHVHSSSYIYIQRYGETKTF